MKLKAAVVLGGLALAAVMTAPSQAAPKAGSGGFGHHSFQGRGFGHNSFHSRGFGRRSSSAGLWYGGIGTYDPYSYPYVQAYGTGDDTIIKFVAPPEPPRALTCKHSEETKAVPSEAGGVAQIVVTRC